MKTRIITITLLCAAVAGLSGCASLGKYKSVEKVSDSLYGATALSDSASNIANFSWREFFTDPGLRTLIDTALLRNQDLLIADEHIKQAQAALTGAKLSFVPTLGLTPGFTTDYRGDKMQNQTYNWQINASASWQLSIFRLINDVKSAKATVSQMQDCRQAVMSKLIADIAANYSRLLMYDEQLETAQKMEKSWMESVETVKFLKEAGLTDQVAVSQYEANLEKIRISIDEIEDNMNACETAICILTGKEVGQRIQRGRLEDQKVPSKITVGVPVQLLTLRPDVRAAERDMENAHYAKRGAILNYFPTLTLNGSAGLVNPLSGAISPMEALAEVGAGLTAPILNAGRNRSALEQARSKQAETKLAFEKTLISAGKEVNDAMNDYALRTDMAKRYRIRVDALDKARENTEYLMRNSLDKTYLDVLFAWTNYFDARLALIENDALRLQACVNLYNALGGGAL